VKRRKTLTTVLGWYKQAVEAANRRAIEQAGDVFPVVIAREDGQPEPIVILSLEDFLELADAELRLRMGLAAVAP
jgi:hypothetical protein